MQSDVIGTIRIGNKRAIFPDHKPEPGEVIVNIDRPNVLANPYVITPKRTRQQAIDEFRAGLEPEIKRRDGDRYRAICEIVEHLFAGRDVILMCWCHPLPCHGEVIKEIAERFLKP